MAHWVCEGCRQDNPAGTLFCGHCGRPAGTVVPPAAAPFDEAVPGPAATGSVEEVLRSFVTGVVADRLVESGGRLTKERRLVTALFADLSGFTALAGRLDPEQLLEVIDPVIAGLTDVVGAHGGYVEKFAGDALLAFFGAPVAHEDDADRALRVALEMHARLPALCDGVVDGALTLHVGVNSGHVVARMVGSHIRMDYAVLGDAVVLAQRLESMAPSGQTYVGEATRRLAGDRFVLDPLGPLAVKGRVEQVTAWRLVGERTEPVTARGRLVGRRKELTRGRQALEILAAGRGCVLSVVGEAGVGKSHLLSELRHDATSAGASWSEARCLPSLTAAPYRPYAELTRSRLGLRFDAPPAEVMWRLRAELDGCGLPGRSGYLAQMLGLPRTSGEGDALEPQALRRAIDDSVVAWVRELARRGPAVLVLEDVHWADASSLALTEQLARTCADVPLALLLTGRPEAADLLGVLTDGLAPEVVTLLRVDSIGVDELGALLVDELGGPVTPELARVVAGRSGGNPLFALEIVRSLQESGGLVSRHGLWSSQPGLDAAQVPPTLEGLLSARMDLLPQSAVRALQTAAVVGRRMRISMLGELLGGAAQTDSDLAVLTERGFLEPAGEDLLAFRHVLVQDVAYSRLLRREQRELHAAVAEVAERRYGAGDETVDLLARHLYLARAGGQAVSYLLRAGLRAARLYANAEATMHLERAVELVRDLPGQQDRLPGLLLELAQVHELVGRYDDALRLYEEVRGLCSDLRAWRGAAGVLRKQGRYEAVLALLDTGLDVPGATSEELGWLQVERGRTELFQGRFADAIATLRRGLTTAPDDSLVGAHLLLLLTRAQMSAGDPVAALDLGLRTLDQLKAHEDTRGLAIGLRVVGSVYEALGRFEEAVVSLAAGLEQAERTGDVEEIGGCLLNLGMAQMGRGRPVEAIDSSRRALVEFERVGHQLGTATASANLAEWLMLSGRHDEAAGYCQQALDLAKQLGDRLTLADALLTMARVRLGQGRSQEAAADADRAAEEFEALGVVSFAERGRQVAAEARASAEW